MLPLAAAQSFFDNSAICC